MHTHRTFYSTGSLLGLLVLFVYLYTVSTVFAADSSQTYVPLIGIPGVSTNSSLPDYINNIYKITIGVGAIFAVVRIALAGVKYSMSGVVTDKASAKADIKGVLLGLAILLLPALVLGTINPQILNLDVLKNVGSKVHMVPFKGTGKNAPSVSLSDMATPESITAAKADLTKTLKSDCSKDPRDGKICGGGSCGTINLCNCANGTWEAGACFE